MASPARYGIRTTLRVCMFVPGGQRWFASHALAVETIMEEYPAAVRVRRWQENHLQYEDYMNNEGDVLVQLEFPYNWISLDHQ